VGDSTGRFLMSIVVRISPQNMTRQQYDTVRNALTEAGDWPADGCQAHVLFGDEGDLRVSEVWESRAKLDAFGEKLRPEIQAAGIQLSGEPEVFEAHIVETF
jgi:quinol monooxygenase YgiN